MKNQDFRLKDHCGKQDKTLQHNEDDTHTAHFVSFIHEKDNLPQRLAKLTLGTTT